MTAPSNIIDFSHYLPPGVYMNPVAGPQLSVNSTQPTAVGIIGQTVGYKTYIQTVQINPDTTGPAPSINTLTQGAAGINDVQVITIEGTPGGGTFTLTFGGQTTSGIAYNASASDVQTAIRGLSSVGSGNANVTGSAGGPYTVTFVSALGSAAQSVITANGASLTGGDEPSVSVAHQTTGAAPVNEVQLVTVAATSGTFSLVFDNQTTATLAYNAPASTVQTALQALSSIGSGNATVSGSPGGPYTVTFVGALAGTNVATITAGVNSNLVPTPTQTLAMQGINTDSLIVTNPNSGQSYTLGTDYTVTKISGVETDNSDATYAIYRVIDGGHITPGDFIQVSYQYTDSTYYDSATFFTYNDVVRAYGEPYNTATGVIQSGLSLMAKFAFLNGAFQVVCVAVRSSTTPGNATVGDYNVALGKLANQSLVAVVVADSGAQPLHQIMQQHVSQQSRSRFERRAICAVDGTTVAVPSSQRIIDAQAITDSRVLLVCPAVFRYFSPEVNQVVKLGGQYVAAALAGLTVSQSFAMPLTRKSISGFIDVDELEPEGQKSLESQNGLCVIEKTRTQVIQVRHGVSTNPRDLLTREWSIIGQQDALVFRLRDYLESANLIGQPIYPYTLVNVKGSAEAALQSLIRDGLIVDYTGLSVRQLATNPDVLEVNFNWLPAFPLNYIVCTFSVSLTTGNLTSTSGTSANSRNVTNATSTAIGAPSSSSFNDFGGGSNTLQST